ncbi:MAG: Lrp/AsnC family transcriptional regulator [Bacteroidota bacterium]
MKKLDNLDIKILSELQKNARVANAEIGRRIGLTGPAVAERIQKMEEEGIIKGYHTILDYDKLDLSVRVFINFRSKSIKHAAMVKMVQTLPEVLEWHTITGDNCLLLNVAVPTTKHLENLIERLGEHGDTTTSIILSSAKNPTISLNNRIASK